jgi:hypothetical protein
LLEATGCFSAGWGRRITLARRWRSERLIPRMSRGRGCASTFLVDRKRVSLKPL